MELQAVLVLCGVGVAGIAVLLLMGLFSTSGTSYEEAIAQQRKATTELLALADNKNKPKKNNKKAIKKLAKKEKKENAAAATGSEPESEAPTESGVEEEPATTGIKAHVEFSPPVVVDIPRDCPLNVKIRKRGKDPKVKPILLNKEDPSCVSDPSAITTAAATPVVNHFEEMHPKDDFELLHTALAAEKYQEKGVEVVEKKEKPAKAAKGGKAVVKPAEPVKEEPTRERRNSGDGPKEQRKSKKTEKKHEKVVEETPVVEEIVPPLNAPQPSELTTDKLLKQALAATPAPAPAPVPAPAPTPPAVAVAVATPPGGKKKKKAEPNVLSLMAGDSGGVNVGELVRVVREAPLSRNEIQILTDALLNKHHDPLPEHSEWTEGPNDPMQKLKKQLADKERALADEVEASQALQAKLKELRATLNAERRSASSAARAASDATGGLRAELHTLQTRIARLIDENRALAQEKLLAEGALVQQLSALQADAQAHALDAGAARLDAAAARDNAIMAQQHAADMAQQLQEANRACTELEQQRQMAVHAEQHAQQELHQAQERLAAMTELQNEIQRLSSRAQTAEANVDKIKEEADRQKQQLSNEIASLGEQLAAREAELAEIKQLKAAPAQNGLPTNDQHKAAELAKVESVVSSLREELSAAQRGARDQRDQLARLQDQLQHYQDKNNELRTKNWKVMEALQSAEKALQTKSASALPAQDLRETISKAQEAQYAEVASILRVACPTAAPSTPAGREWLQAFADNLKNELEHRIEKQTEKRELHTQTAKPENRELYTQTTVDDRVHDLQSQNEQLQALVDKYKNIIDHTEGMLSNLQQNVMTEEQLWAQQLADKQRELDELRQKTVLQEGMLSNLQQNVMTEEQLWAQQLADKQRELDELRQKTVLQLQNKIDTLEAQLAQAAANNHKHSFADAERITEERLMGGLSEKHNDVCNGPSQVGLDK